MTDVYTMKPDGNESDARPPERVAPVLVAGRSSSSSWFVRTRSLRRLRPCDTDGRDAAVVGLTVPPLGRACPIDATSLGPGMVAGRQADRVRGLRRRIKLITPAGESVGPIGPPVLVRACRGRPIRRSSRTTARTTGAGGSEVVVLLDRASGRETVLRGEQQSAAASRLVAGRRPTRLQLDGPRSTASGSCRDQFVPRSLWVDGAGRHEGSPGRHGVSQYGAASWARAVDAAPVLPPPLHPLPRRRLLRIRP